MDAIVLHHIFTALEFHPAALDFHPVEANLRECFRVLAAERARGEALELPGVSIASAGVTFQMFNAAFLSSPVESHADLEERVVAATKYFASRGMRWSFWVCEDWISKKVRRKAPSVFQEFGMYLSSEMPGMAAEQLISAPAHAAYPPLEMRPLISPLNSGINSEETLRDFRQIGAFCFRVPPVWFAEVFDGAMSRRPGFNAWVGYAEGIPVGTAAAVVSGGVSGLYNIAILPEYRRRGYGSAITQFAAHEAMRLGGTGGLILQSSSQGLRMYERMGFRTVTRVLVYNSA